MLRLIFGFIGIFMLCFSVLITMFEIYPIEDIITCLSFSILFMGISVTGNKNEY